MYEMSVWVSLVQQEMTTWGMLDLGQLQDLADLGGLPVAGLTRDFLRMGAFTVATSGSANISSFLSSTFSFPLPLTPS